MPPQFCLVGCVKKQKIDPKLKELCSDSQEEQTVSRSAVRRLRCEGDPDGPGTESPQLPVTVPVSSQF